MTAAGCNVKDVNGVPIPNPQCSPFPKGIDDIPHLIGYAAD